MRLSVIAVSLVLISSQSALAQHSSGGGGSSGGGTSSGGSSSGSSGGSHGGSYSGGGSSSGGHVSGGSSGSLASGSSGSAHATPSHAATGLVYSPGKIDPLHGTVTGREGEAGFYLSAHGDSPEVHNYLLDQALSKIQFTVPTNLKSEQPISAKSLRRVEIDPARKTERKPDLRKEEPDRKHCHGHNCKFTTCTLGSTWRMSEDLYSTILDDCARLSAKLTKEGSKALALQDRRGSVCATDPIGSACISATQAVNRLSAKISQLHDRYDQCVLHDVRRKAVIRVSQK